MQELVPHAQRSIGFRIKDRMRKVDSKIDLLCVGQATYDLVFLVPGHPGPDEKAVATKMASFGGGPAANAAVAAARLGARAAFSGYLSLDEFGQRHYQELANEKIELQYTVRGTAPSPISTILVKPDGRRTAVNYRAATSPLSPGAIDFSSCNPGAVLFDGLEPWISPPLASDCRAAGIPTILDAGSVHEGSRALVSLVDYLVCSERFARQFTGLAEEWAALRALSQLASRTVITLGPRGLIWRRGDEEGALPAFPVQVVDTTGAGDAFHGAFSLAISRAMGWEDSLNFASRVAALTCLHLGARPGLPTLEELEATQFGEPDDKLSQK